MEKLFIGGSRPRLKKSILDLNKNWGIQDLQETGTGGSLFILKTGRFFGEITIMGKAILMLITGCGILKETIDGGLVILGVIVFLGDINVSKGS